MLAERAAAARSMATPTGMRPEVSTPAGGDREREIAAQALER